MANKTLEAKLNDGARRMWEAERTCLDDDETWDDLTARSRMHLRNYYEFSRREALEEAAAVAESLFPRHVGSGLEYHAANSIARKLREKAKP